jgi:pSer/pThr/pTyr-binding forkhead associated (FHA) protein
MPLLRSGADRCVLRPGANTLGGRGSNALPVPALAWQPAVATITVQPQGPVLIQRTTAAVVVRVNDEPLGVGPAELHHGAHIDFAGCRLTYDAEVGSAAEEGSGASTAQIPMANAPAGPRAGSQLTPAQLLHLSTGRIFTLPGRRIVIGRDDACDLQLDGEGVSRRHCAIAPVPGGYLLTDESSNGTLVNGARIGRTHILDDGDILRLHDEELRFELTVPERDGPRPAEASSRAATAVLDLSRLRGTDLTPDERRAALRPSPTASLEIIRGPFTGASFHIARPVAAIGRGEQSDVRLRDESVSSAHATLLRKGNTWYVVDLRSVNGTFVDGYRIAGERELTTGATLRVGSVELLFRSFSNGAEDPRPRPERRGVMQRAARLWRMLFPKPVAND